MVLDVVMVGGLLEHWSDKRELLGLLELLSQTRIAQWKQNFKQPFIQVRPHYLMGNVQERGPVPVLRIKSINGKPLSISISPFVWDGGGRTENADERSRLAEAETRVVQQSMLDSLKMLMKDSSLFVVLISL